MTTGPIYLVFNGPIDGNSAGRITGHLINFFNQGCDPIHLLLSSSGGFIDDGLCLYNFIRSMRPRVHVKAIGAVSSIAVPVLLGGETRTATPVSLLMLHPTTWPTAGTPTIAAIRDSLTMAEHHDLLIESLFKSETCLPDHMLAQRRIAEVVLTPEQGLEYGFVQSVDHFAIPAGAQVFQV